MLVLRAARRFVTSNKDDINRLIYKGIDIDDIINKAKRHSKDNALEYVRDKVLLLVKDAERDIDGLRMQVNYLKREKMAAEKEYVV
jgi:hypothetical protein